MSTKHVVKIIGLLLCLGMALAAPQTALAAGTPACTPIGNTASVAFKIGTFDQTPVSSNTNTITVGNRVNHTVTAADAAPGVSVVSNQTGAQLHFTITNNGNASQRYALTPANFGNGVVTNVFSGLTSTLDGFNATITSPTYTVTGVVSEGTSTTITIAATMPAGLTNETYAVLELVAYAMKSNGTTTEGNNSSSIDSSYGSCTADVVLSDPAGPGAPGTADALYDGKHSARDAYHAVLTTLNVTKSSIIYSDPVGNAYPNAKAIPGAIVEYIVVMTNNGGSTATAVTITDNLPLTTVDSIDAAAWTSQTAGGGSGCSGFARAAITGVNAGAWNCLNGAANGGTSGWAGGGVNNSLTATVDNLVSGGTATVVFQATIQ